MNNKNSIFILVCAASVYGAHAAEIAKPAGMDISSDQLSAQGTILASMTQTNRQNSQQQERKKEQAAEAVVSISRQKVSHLSPDKLYESETFEVGSDNAKHYDLFFKLVREDNTVGLEKFLTEYISKGNEFDIDTVHITPKNGKEYYETAYTYAVKHKRKKVISILKKFGADTDLDLAISTDIPPRYQHKQSRKRFKAGNSDKTSW